MTRPSSTSNGPRRPARSSSTATAGDIRRRFDVDGTVADDDLVLGAHRSGSRRPRRRSRIPGTWAQVDAVLSGLDLSAPGADDAHCPDTGIAWTEGAEDTTCKITFVRWSANQSVKAGQSLPTATLAATATWTASWTSPQNATPTALPAQTLTTTAEIPVAEIQTIVTSR